jgi:hypothetical protein
MVLDMLLDGAVCFELHATADSHPDLFYASLAVWLAPYACLWAGIFNLLCLLLLPSQSSFCILLVKALGFFATLGLGIPLLLITDLFFVTFFLFANLESSKHLVYYERLRYLAEAMIEAPLTIAFQAYVITYSSNIDSDIYLEPTLLPVSLAMSLFSLVYQYWNLRARASHSQVSFSDQLLAVLHVGMGSLPFVAGISNGSLVEAKYLYLDLHPSDVRKIVHAVNSPHAVVQTLVIKGCMLSQAGCAELEMMGGLQVGDSKGKLGDSKGDGKEGNECKGEKKAAGKDSVSRGSADSRDSKGSRGSRGGSIGRDSSGGRSSGGFDHDEGGVPLHTLCLAENNFGSVRCFQSLVCMLPALRRLRRLDLRGNILNDEAKRTLAQGLLQASEGVGGMRLDEWLCDSFEIVSGQQHQEHAPRRSEGSRSGSSRAREALVGSRHGQHGFVGGLSFGSKLGEQRGSSSSSSSSSSLRSSHISSSSRKTVDLRDKGLTTVDLMVVAAVIKTSTVVEVLLLSSNWLGVSFNDAPVGGGSTARRADVSAGTGVNAGASRSPLARRTTSSPGHNETAGALALASLGAAEDLEGVLTLASVLPHAARAGLRQLDLCDSCIGGMVEAMAKMCAKDLTVRPDRRRRGKKTTKSSAALSRPKRQLDMTDHTKPPSPMEKAKGKAPNPRFSPTNTLGGKGQEAHLELVEVDLEEGGGGNSAGETVVSDDGYAALLDGMLEAAACGLEGLDLSGGLQSKAMSQKLGEVQQELEFAFQKKQQQHHKGSVGTAVAVAAKKTKPKPKEVAAAAPDDMIASDGGAGDGDARDDSGAPEAPEGSQDQGKGSKRGDRAVFSGYSSTRCDVWWDLSSHGHRVERQESRAVLVPPAVPGSSMLAKVDKHASRVIV